MVLGRFGLRGEELRALIEVLEPHQRADALVQRVLVADHGERATRSVTSMRYSASSRGAKERACRCAHVHVVRAAAASGIGDRAPRLAARSQRAAPALSRTSSARASRSARGELRRHDRAHFGSAKAAPRDDAADLLVLRAVDDQHPIDDGRRRAPAAAGPRGCRRDPSSAAISRRAAARISGCRIASSRARASGRRTRDGAARRGRSFRRAAGIGAERLRAWPRSRRRPARSARARAHRCR